MLFVISNSAENLASYLSKFEKTATVEAEYGDVVVEGTEVTLAHHGSRSDNEAPCLYDDGEVEVEVVGLSHIDLDTLGGCMGILGEGREEDFSFWRLAAFVDVNGPHKLNQAGACQTTDIEKLYAFWAWSKENRFFPPRDGSVVDCTDFVHKAIDVIEKILAGNEPLLEEGKKFRVEEEKLNKASFVDASECVILRSSDGSFVNSLYTTPSGEVKKAVVGFNTKTGAITLSFAEDVGLSACKIMQDLFGMKAGGHKGIAGTPREETFTLDDAKSVAATVDWLFLRLNKK